MGAGDFLEGQVGTGRGLSKGPDYAWEIFGLDPLAIAGFLFLLAVTIFISVWFYKRGKINFASSKKDTWKALGAIGILIALFWTFGELGLFLIAGIQIGVLIGLLLSQRQRSK